MLSVIMLNVVILNVANNPFMLSVVVLSVVMLSVVMLSVVASFSQRFIFSRTYEWAKKARLFVPSRLFQCSLMFVSSVEDYLSEAPFRCSAVG